MNFIQLLYIKKTYQRINQDNNIFKVLPIEKLVCLNKPKTLGLKNNHNDNHTADKDDNDDNDKK